MRSIVARRAQEHTAYEAFPAICIGLRVSAPQARGRRSAGLSYKPSRRIAREPGHQRTNRPLAPTGGWGVDISRSRPCGPRR
jgi:hypothetical protein